MNAPLDQGALDGWVLTLSAAQRAVRRAARQGAQLARSSTTWATSRCRSLCSAGSARAPHAVEDPHPRPDDLAGQDQRRGRLRRRLMRKSPRGPVRCFDCPIDPSTRQRRSTWPLNCRRCRMPRTPSSPPTRRAPSASTTASTTRPTSTRSTSSPLAPTSRARRWKRSSAPWPATPPRCRCSTTPPRCGTTPSSGTA